MLLVVGIVVSGLIIGALGRLLVPGPNPMSVVRTALVGVGGAVLGGTVGNLMLGRPGGLIIAVLGAAAIVWWLELRSDRQAGAS